MICSRLLPSLRIASISLNFRSSSPKGPKYMCIEWIRVQNVRMIEAIVKFKYPCARLSSSRLTIQEQMRGVMQDGAPIAIPAMPQAVPTTLSSTPNGMQVNKPEQNMPIVELMESRNTTTTTQCRAEGDSQLGRKYRKIVAMKNYKEAAKYAILRYLGQSDRNLPATIDSTVSAEKGIMPNRPASKQANPNLFTSRSLLLSMKLPQLASVQNMPKITIQNEFVIDFMSAMIDLFSSSFISQGSPYLLKIDSAKASLYFRSYLLRASTSRIPDIRENPETRAPIYTGAETELVESQTRVVIIELMASAEQPKPHATLVRNQQLSEQYLARMMPCTVQIPSPPNPNMALAISTNGQQEPGVYQNMRA